jgi:type II secretory pathway component PulM
MIVLLVLILLVIVLYLAFWQDPVAARIHHLHACQRLDKLIPGSWDTLVLAVYSYLKQ